MPNIGNIISMHNGAITSKPEPEPVISESEQRNDNQKQSDKCNCRDSDDCPLQNKCLTTGIIYQAIVTRQDNTTDETYIGLTANSFKSRHAAHTTSFNHDEYRNATTLSEYIWKLKDMNVPYSLQWKIISKGKPYSTATKKCNLCTEEKYFIIFKPNLSTLNKRNELMSSCRHRKKHLLCNYE